MGVGKGGGEYHIISALCRYGGGYGLNHRVQGVVTLGEACADAVNDADRELAGIKGRVYLQYLVASVAAENGSVVIQGREGCGEHQGRVSLCQSLGNHRRGVQAVKTGLDVALIVEYHQLISRVESGHNHCVFFDLVIVVAEEGEPHLALVVSCALREADLLADHREQLVEDLIELGGDLGGMGRAHKPSAAVVTKLVL